MYIGIDIGGTFIRIASSESSENPKIVEKRVLPDSSDYEMNEAVIIRTIRALSQQADGVGVGMMGRLNAQKTGIVASRSAPQWIDRPLGTRLSDVFDCPVVINGDQYCGALSEAVISGQSKDFLYVTCGTGIGAARVAYREGRPAVEKISDEEHAMYCQQWQQDCGGMWAAKTFGKPMADFSEAEWSIVMNNFYGHLLTLITGLKPPRLVFGGGVAIKQWPRLQQVFARLRSDHPDLRQLDVRQAGYGEEAGLYGALYLVGQNSWRVHTPLSNKAA